MKSTLVFCLIFIANGVVSQSYLNIQSDSGISNWLHIETINGDKQLDLDRTTSIPNLAFSASYIKRIQSSEYHAGLKLNVGLGGKYSAFVSRRWIQRFLGLKLGYKRKVGRTFIGLNTISNLKVGAVPTIVGPDGEFLTFKTSYIFELNPSMEVALWKDKFFLHLDYSITPFPIYNNVLPNEEVSHRINYFNTGLSYRFTKKSNSRH